MPDACREIGLRSQHTDGKHEDQKVAATALLSATLFNSPQLLHAQRNLD